MSIRDIAKALGRLGGRARAKRLSPEHKSQIASLGGRARSHSLKAERRIAENFRYVAALRGLAPKPNKAERVKNTKSRLPGIYA